MRYLPVARSSGLPGSREEAWRAGMTMAVRMADLLVRRGWQVRLERFRRCQTRVLSRRSARDGYNPGRWTCVPVAGEHGMQPPTPTAPASDPFRYGWRYVRRTLPDGTETLEQVPLTLRDVLHPQEDDVIPENSQHEGHRRYFHDVFKRRLSRQATIL